MIQDLLVPLAHQGLPRELHRQDLQSEALKKVKFFQPILQAMEVASEQRE
jgi:hypothetical protein